MYQQVKEKMPYVYFLLKSHRVKIEEGNGHFIRAWRVERVEAYKPKEPSYALDHFCLTHSDLRGNMILTLKFKTLEDLSTTMSALIESLRLTFETK